MDPFSYEKPRLWLNIVCMAILILTIQNLRGFDEK